MSTNVQTVQRIYQAFSTGDAATILAQLAEDVRWDHFHRTPDAPWLKPRQGPADVGGFFATVMECLDFKAFQVKEILDGGHVVVALVDLTAEVRRNGRVVVESDETHIWRFNAEGKVNGFRHGADTAQHDAAWNNA